MSLRLMAEVAKEIRAREQKEIDRLANKGAELLTAAALEGPILLKQQSQELVSAIAKNREYSQNRGFRRLRHGRAELRTDNYTDYAERDFITLLDFGDYLRRIVREPGPIYIERGIRTLPFALRPDTFDGIPMQTGWEAGYVMGRWLKSPGVSSKSRLKQVAPGLRVGCFPTPVESKLDKEPKPIRVWEVVTGSTSLDSSDSVERRAVLFDIDRRTGDLTSYTDSQPDNEVEEIVNSAETLALGILRSAIEFVEQ